MLLCIYTELTLFNFVVLFVILLLSRKLSWKLNECFVNENHWLDWFPFTFNEFFLILCNANWKPKDVNKISIMRIKKLAWPLWMDNFQYEDMHIKKTLVEKNKDKIETLKHKTK